MWRLRPGLGLGEQPEPPRAPVQGALAERFRGRRNAGRTRSREAGARLARLFRPGALAGRAGLRRGGLLHALGGLGGLGRGLAVPIDGRVIENRSQLDRAQAQVIDRLAEVDDLLLPIIAAYRDGVFGASLKIPLSAIRSLLLEDQAGPRQFNDDCLVQHPARVRFLQQCQ